MIHAILLWVFVVLVAGAMLAGIMSVLVTLLQIFHDSRDGGAP